jgi:hypothetical protein
MTPNTEIEVHFTATLAIIDMNPGDSTLSRFRPRALEHTLCHYMLRLDTLKVG